ncbi:hypothetical protein BLOT_010661 [Blomia tropicalis]|nr:hypothetical protein BLOT_010661 [Blomia tropicalis]
MMNEKQCFQLDGSTYHGSVRTTMGGVGRNMADTIQCLGQQCLLITAVGDDLQGRLVRANNSNLVRHSNIMELIVSVN